MVSSPRSAWASLVIFHNSLRVPPACKNFFPVRSGYSLAQGLDVLTAVRSLGKPEFTNEDAYTLTSHLEKLHPGNRHIRDKIRQQLQLFRDTGLLLHLQPARWQIP